MRIHRIVLRYVSVPLRAVFENRWQRISTWTKLIVEVHSGDSIGYGECMAMETPFYSYETIETAWWVITRWLAKPLLDLEFEHPREIPQAFSRISGHHEGKAALECAAWDLYARMHSMPLCELFGGSRRPVATGATVGVQKDIETALRAVETAVSAGYTRLKIKIKSGWDEELLGAIRTSFPQVTILADANAAYEEKDIDWLASLERFAPIVIEQPFPGTDWINTAALQAKTSAPVCLDESITCLDDVEQMIHTKAARLVNLKVGRVGGITNAIRIHDRCAEAGIPVFIGSKTETGIGRWMNIGLGTLSNVRFPSDVAASERYFVEEIVKEPVRTVGPGLVEPLPGPGFGTEVDPVQLAKYTVKTEVLPE